MEHICNTKIKQLLMTLEYQKSYQVLVMEKCVIEMSKLQVNRGAFGWYANIIIWSYLPLFSLNPGVKFL